MRDGGEARTARGAETRTRILETALELFKERGYEETTMRAIAREAGVALGNAYYYFRSKEQLIQAFYARTHEEHVAASEPILAAERELKPRLLGVLRAKTACIRPYHRFAGILFRTAADPASPLNPFNPASRPVREQSIRVFAEVIEGAERQRVPADLAAKLPELLWLYHMGIILYWIHDRSPGGERTERLIERTVDVVVRLINLASMPLMRPLRRATLRLIAELEGADPEDAAAPS